MAACIFEMGNHRPPECRNFSEMARLRRVIQTGDVISLLSFDRNWNFFPLCGPLAIRIFLLSVIIGITS